MHRELNESWRGTLDARGDSVAVVVADSGVAWTFRQIEARAEAWLAAHPEAKGVAGRVWCLVHEDRVEWLVVFLAAIKAGAVVLPLEPEARPSLRERATALGASLLIGKAGVESLPGGRPREGYFLIKLTSGTTGRPKAMPFTEAEMMADGAQIMRSMSISADDRNFAILPLGHSYALGNLVLPFFMAGVPLVLGSSPYPQVMLEELRRHPCTVLPLVPPLVKAIAAVSVEPGALAGLRLVLSAGSVLKPSIARRFHERTGLRVHNFYGSSETGGICFDRSGQAATAEGVVGTPLDGVALSLAEDGSIRVRSGALCHSLYPHGVAKLHDFGEFLPGQVLRLTGRHADIVKVAGRRLSLTEVERALCAVAGVTDAYVTTRERRSGEIRCVALFAGEGDAELVRRALGVQLPDWKLPKVLHKVDRIVYTARGKKDRPAMEQVVDSLTDR